MTDIEIEIQVRLERVKPLLDFLKEKGTFKGQKRQIDEYYSPAKRDFLAARPVKEWFRLRDADSKYSVNYKKWHFGKDGRSQFSDEYESEISDVNQFRKILNALNFKSLVVVDKTRQIWLYKNYEIGIDSVKKLGSFVEIEYKGHKKVSPKKITNKMVKFLKEIGCGKIERNYVGYPFQLLFGEEVKFEIQ